jgi:tRNA modification GTPase
MNPDDTIIAISSAIGAAQRLIVRASGSLARQIHCDLTSSNTFVGSAARRTRLAFNGLSVPAWVYTFAAPRSVTGEDVIELHIPGNPLLARMLLNELARHGARQAGPGEFTARAYFNGRLDLSEAEGVAAVIAAQSQHELSAARQLMAGELTRRLRPVLDAVAGLLALVEAGLDFSDQDVAFVSTPQVLRGIDDADATLQRLVCDSARFERLSHEPQMVLAGWPNAGKSTLLNALAGARRAVVSHVQGTTRDAIWAHVSLPRGRVRLIDVAGIDPSAADSIPFQMQQRAQHTIQQADVLVLVRDCTDTRPAPPLPRTPDLFVAAKSDLGGTVTGHELPISALTGHRLDVLRERLDKLAFGQAGSGATLALNARHVQSINAARHALARARQCAADAAELLALELREALDALGTIGGAVTADELLGRIFATFCIGK